jgi:PEP-CTERM motif-containing protein
VRKLLSLCLLSLFIAPLYSEAAPISVNCPDSASTTDREFTLTTDPLGATCLAYGDAANELNGNAFDVMVLAGWTVIDKDESSSELDNWFSVTGMGANSGTFTVDPAAWGEFGELAIGFVVGAGQILPKWAVFGLPDFETEGLWSNVPQQGAALSHAILYGRGEGRDITEVPEPATLFLLGSGLTFAVRRRRKS